MTGIVAVTARIGEIQSRFGVEAPPASGDFSATLSGLTAPAAPPVSGGLSARGAGAGAAAGDWAGALPPAGRQWAEEITAAATAEGVDPRLLAALVWQESGFDAGARSPAGATGLAQLMPGTARELGVDPTDPVANLRGGARYLRQQLDRFGSADLALAAYNAGPGRVAQAGGVPQIAETQTYVRRVLERYAALGASR